MDGDQYKKEYKQIKKFAEDNGYSVLHDSISPQSDNRFGLKEGMKFKMDDKEYTISWVTGAGEVFFEEGGFMYDYEVKEYI